MTTDPIRLTQYSHGAGCGCKIAPDVLTRILQQDAELDSTVTFPNLVVGHESRDDAAAVKLNEQHVVLSTTDFFMPIVDDPYDFGRIAATNAISDIYAMGAQPLFALALLGMPINVLPLEVIQRIIAGGESVCHAAGIPIAGHLADRFGRRRFLLWITSLIFIFGLSFKSFLAPEIMGTGTEANLTLMTLFLSLGMALMGLSFGPMSALLPELFPTNTRYSGSGVAYNGASILGAALTPFVAAWLAGQFGPGAVGLYLTALSALTLLALWWAPETSTLDLDR